MRIWLVIQLHVKCNFVRILKAWFWVLIGPIPMSDNILIFKMMYDLIIFSTSFCYLLINDILKFPAIYFCGYLLHILWIFSRHFQSRNHIFSYQKLHVIFLWFAIILSALLSRNLSQIFSLMDYFSDFIFSSLYSTTKIFTPFSKKSTSL